MALTLEDLTIPPEPEKRPITDSKRRDLLVRNPRKADFILTVERLWEEFALALDAPEIRERRLHKLLKALQFTIQKKAETLERKWVNKKISAADFESEFWITAWELCEEKYSPHTPFYLYETFLLALDRKGIDVVRKYTRVKKRTLNTGSLSLLEHAKDWLSSGEDIEGHITDRMLVEQILRDKVLTDLEREILWIKYEDPDLSLRKIGEKLGMHVEEVRRTMVRIKKKLRDYDYLWN